MSDTDDGVRQKHCPYTHCLSASHLYLAYDASRLVAGLTTILCCTAVLSLSTSLCCCHLLQIRCWHPRRCALLVTRRRRSATNPHHHSNPSEQCSPPHSPTCPAPLHPRPAATRPAQPRLTPHCCRRPRPSHTPRRCCRMLGLVAICSVWCIWAWSSFCGWPAVRSSSGYSSSERAVARSFSPTSPHRSSLSTCHPTTLCRRAFDRSSVLASSQHQPNQPYPHLSTPSPPPPHRPLSSPSLSVSTSNYHCCCHLYGS